MRSFQGFVFLVGTLCFIPWLWAKPEIDVSLKPSGRLKVGEICQLTVQVSWRSEEADYAFRKPEIAFERLVIEDLGESNEVVQKEGEAWKRKTFRFSLKAVQPGEARIDSFRLSYIDPANQTEGHFEVQPFEFKVVPDRSRLYRNAVWTAGLLGAAGGGIAWFLWARKKRERKAAASKEPTLEDRYVSQLTGLKEGKSLPPDQKKIFEAGRLFRSYLNEKYSVPTGFVTTQELLEKIRGKVPEDELRTLKKIFEKLDEGRYAQTSVSREAEEAFCSEMIRYVEGKKVLGV